MDCFDNDKTCTSECTMVRCFKNILTDNAIDIIDINTLDCSMQNTINFSHEKFAIT